jgi:hypothetical protein
LFSDDFQTYIEFVVTDLLIWVSFSNHQTMIIKSLQNERIDLTCDSGFPATASMYILVYKYTYVSLSIFRVVPFDFPANMRFWNCTYKQIIFFYLRTNYFYSAQCMIYLQGMIWTCLNLPMIYCTFLNYWNFLNVLD